MNDLVIIGFIILGILCPIIGAAVVYATMRSKYMHYGYGAGIICFFVALAMIPCAGKVYSKLPYLEPVIYELSEKDSNNISIAEEKNSITFSDTDNVYHTITYEDLTKEYQEGEQPRLSMYINVKEE